MNADWLSKARALAADIAREKGSVTVDDVRDRLAPPDDCDPRILGGIFRAPQFSRIGYRNSARRTCHGRPIGVFALRG